MKNKADILVETVFEIEPYGYINRDGGTLISTEKVDRDDVPVFTETQVEQILVGVMDQILSKIGWNAEGWTNEFVDENVQ